MKGDMKLKYMGLIGSTLKSLMDMVNNGQISTEVGNELSHDLLKLVETKFSKQDAADLALVTLMVSMKASSRKENNNETAGNGLN